ncbi:hypothetical protein [uncultured Limnobacter sp.]|uniref:hypothetical protein n=1 Tax=uncultured Limnobacter sp. TaxID=199681 RepID=UPI000C5F8D29|nr:hypothetical protein [uncultured Limnobacter sp.]MAZ09379.1 hypothetical protein [Sutterellaceae bacterium]
MIGATRVLRPKRASIDACGSNGNCVGVSTGEAWVLRRLADFARLPGGFAARGDLQGRCEDAYAFRMPQARSIKPDQKTCLGKAASTLA